LKNSGLSDNACDFDIISYRFMPEDLNKSNDNSVRNEKRASKSASETRSDFTDKSVDDFEKVLDKVRKRMEAKRQNEANMKMRDPMLSGDLYNDDLERRAKKQRDFEKANQHLQTLREARSALKTRSADEKEAEIRRQKKIEIEKAIKDQMGEGMNQKQKFMQEVVIKLAGEKALDIMYIAADKLSSQVEKGGGRAISVIMFTFFLAIIKDLLDVLLTPFFPPVGWVLSLFLGIFVSGVLSFFWVLVCESWHGGVMTNQIIKILLKIVLGYFIDGFTGCFLPVYVVINVWCCLDFLSGIRKAKRRLEEINDNIEHIQKDVQNQLRRIDATP